MGQSLTIDLVEQNKPIESKLASECEKIINFIV